VRGQRDCEKRLNKLRASVQLSVPTFSLTETEMTHSSQSSMKVVDSGFKRWGPSGNIQTGTIVLGEDIYGGIEIEGVIGRVGSCLKGGCRRGGGRQDLRLNSREIPDHVTRIKAAFKDK
jgi:hypothetical protein